MKKWILIILCISLSLSLAGCGKEAKKDEAGAGNESEAGKEAGAGDEAGAGEAPGEGATLEIAYQYGLAYAPLIVAKEQGLIEKAYKELTGGEVTVVWNQMNSGPDINTGIASGQLDVGFMGIAPALTGISKNVGYKIFTNLSGQEHGLMTNNSEIHSFEDLIDSEHQIALVNIGSIQHIILGRALSQAGYDAHALDANLVAMKHPDGMAALLSGNAALHLTSNPYIYMERENANLHELTEVSDVWTREESFIVGVAAEQLYKEEPRLYQALCSAIEEAIGYVNENTEETAKLTSEYDGNSLEDEVRYLKEGIYTVETKGIFDLAVFMAENKFIDKAPEAYSDLVFDNVSGD